MAIQFLKKASKTPETETSTAQEVAHAMLTRIEQVGEAAVREYAEKLDKWYGEIVMSDAAKRWITSRY